MSAVVCGKRSSSIFSDHLHSPPASKRIRCGSSSPTRSLSPPRAHLNNSGSSTALAHLRVLFPDMDPQEVLEQLDSLRIHDKKQKAAVSRMQIGRYARRMQNCMNFKLLERFLETSGNDLDSATALLHELRLESNSSTGASRSDRGDQMLQGIMQNTTGVEGSGGLGRSSVADIPADGSEWINLFVGEMRNASDMDDAKARVSRLHEALEKTILAKSGAEAVETHNKETVVLKDQVEMLVRENTILKRAVAIQHERQKDYDERSQELQHLKQLVIQYQEQMRTLEVNNYALMMHLRQAEQNNSIPGRFHPDVF